MKFLHIPTNYFYCIFFKNAHDINIDLQYISFLIILSAKIVLFLSSWEKKILGICRSFSGFYFISTSLFTDDQAIDLMSRVFANSPGDRGSIPGRVIPKSQKMVLDAALLNT